jgi:folate-binding protein YgfZ
MFDNNQEQTMSNCKYFNLSFLSLLRAQGDDTEAFLQGQLTNDIRHVIQEGSSQLSAYCTHKGRMIASMRMIKHGDSIFMSMPNDRLETVLQRLKMFVLMSKVEIDNITDEYRVYGLSGVEAVTMLADNCPANIDETITTGDDISITRIAGDTPRFLIAGQKNAIEKMILQIAELCAEGDKNEWFLQDIRAGLPTVFEETAETFVPQMLNLQLINGVSFTKGCYTGQEVVARMQYLGSLKRRLYRVSYSGDCAPPGSDLYSPLSKSAQGAGKVVMSAHQTDGKCESLIVTEIASADANEVRLQDGNGTRLEFLDLPYAFEQAE